MISVAAPARRRQPVVAAATLPCAASMLGLGLWRPAYPTYHDGVRAMVAAAASKEEPWPSPGRSGAGTRPA
jgi:hypothetical protein